MRASAEYFGFRFDQGAIRGALQDLANRLSAQPQRVRILLARDSRLEIQHTGLGTERFGRVRISSRRVSSSDRFLYHKTTNRQTFGPELAAARRARCDDALFFNERQELTEGAIPRTS
jgi:para-aminobenzoate synthetase/4-amino-4-deoxychorismate lyase